MATYELLLQFPNFLKLLQLVLSLINLICIATTTSVPGSSVIWITEFAILLIVAATIFVIVNDAQNRLTAIIPVQSLTWDIFELVCSCIFCTLSIVSVWLSFCFGFNNKPSGNYVGYTLSMLFLSIQCAAFAIPLCFHCRQAQDGLGESDPIVIQEAAEGYQA